LFEDIPMLLLDLLIFINVLEVPDAKMLQKDGS
jgi:hypothetical protein